ncbi:unnamed protein product [Lampetra planeri]
MLGVQMPVGTLRCFPSHAHFISYASNCRGLSDVNVGARSANRVAASPKDVFNADDGRVTASRVRSARSARAHCRTRTDTTTRTVTHGRAACRRLIHAVMVTPPPDASAADIAYLEVVGRRVEEAGAGMRRLEPG